MNSPHALSIALLMATVAAAGAPLMADAQPPVAVAAAPVAAASVMSVTGVPAVQLDYRGRLLALITRVGGKAVLTIEDVDGSHATPVPIPDGCAPTAVRWARSWSALAVLTRCAADATHPQPTGALWVMDVQRGKPLQRLVDFDGTASQVQWRSDGKVVAFRFTPSAAPGSAQPAISVIMAGPADGGKFGVVSPAGLDVHQFYLSPFGAGLLFTAAPANEPTAPPALYEADGSKVSQLLDPATVQGALHGIRIGRLRLSPTAADRPAPLFFLAQPAAPSQAGADLYMKLASSAAPITNLTAKESLKPGWFEPSGISAVATRVSDGATDLISYVALATGTGLRRARVLCTVPGVITDGGGAGSRSTNGGRYAYFEYPKTGGPVTLNVGAWRLGMACNPRWSRPVAGGNTRGD